MILIFSDSHGRTKDMQDVLANYGNKVSNAMFLGDYEEDWHKVLNNLPMLNSFSVPGNCDYYSEAPREQTITINDKVFWLTHGDRFDVKSGYKRIVDAATSRKADICLFGHTHRPAVFEENGILFLNPGSISEPRGFGKKSYAILQIQENGNLMPKIIQI